jgi:xylulokinase
VLEGVAFTLRHIADLLRDRGAVFEELRVSGGQARSHLWAQIKADVLGSPVAVPRVTDSALIGEALLAASAIGVVKGTFAAAERFVSIRERIEPTAANAAVYNDAYAVYRELYPRLQDLMSRP